MQRKSRSFADLTLGPSQLQQINEESPNQKQKHAEGGPPAATKPSPAKKKKGGGPSVWWIYAFTALALGLGVLYVVDKAQFDDVIQLTADCVAFKRLPATAQDNAAAVVWIVLSIPVIMVLDFCLCYPLSKNHIARWYFLHAATNAIITVLAFPDIYYTLISPKDGISVKYCNTLPFPGCSDLPTCFIVGLHLYHVLFFELGEGDVFHHLLFVPLVGFAHFAYACGSSANILCFFISGFPGGVDYFLLGLVKNGSLPPIKEKRLNCSINTWIRAPGITLSCAFLWCGWVSLEDADQVPTPVIAFWIVLALIFYNGQFYAQRVIGNYYIWKAEGAVKEGKRAKLHPS